jgi:hypothetical protein
MTFGVTVGGWFDCPLGRRLARPPYEVVILSHSRVIRGSSEGRLNRWDNCWVRCGWVNLNNDHPY